MNFYQEVGGYLSAYNCFLTGTNNSYDGTQDSDLEHYSHLLLAFLSFWFLNPVKETNQQTKQTNINEAQNCSPDMWPKQREEQKVAKLSWEKEKSNNGRKGSRNKGPLSYSPQDHTTSEAVEQSHSW